MPVKHDFLFVDESGDPGYTTESISGTLLSSPYYVAAVLHVCDNSFAHINRHMATFRYYTAMDRELKLPPEKEVFERLLGPIRSLANDGAQNICASVVYVDKVNYTGRYLKPGGKRPQDPIRFRNYMLRCLLEFHFQYVRLKSQQYDLVLDRIEMTRKETDNLQGYIAGNRNIPTPTHITHASSIYVEALQIVHHIAGGYKNVVSGAETPHVLEFVRARDVTLDQFIYK